MDTQTTTPTFASFIADERARIQQAINAANAKRQEADDEIAQLEVELAAIAAYDAARKGKKVSAESRAPRGRRGEKRQAILNLVGAYPDGMTRGEIIEAMNAHGDKSSQQSISNALSALKRADRLVQEGKRYVTRSR